MTSIDPLKIKDIRLGGDEPSLEVEAEIAKRQYLAKKRERKEGGRKNMNCLPEEILTEVNSIRTQLNDLIFTKISDILDQLEKYVTEVERTKVETRRLSEKDRQRKVREKWKKELAEASLGYKYIVGSKKEVDVIYRLTKKMGGKIVSRFDKSIGKYCVYLVEWPRW